MNTEKKQSDGSANGGTAALSVTADVLEFVSLALVQNGLPLVGQIKIANKADKALHDVECVFSSDDGLILPSTVSFKEIAAQDSAGKANPGILLNQRRILDVGADAVRSSLLLSVTAGGSEIFQQTFEVTILPPDQWIGLRPYAELISAYVLPNAELVSQIQAETARELEDATGDSAIQGYQADKTRALEICAAIYSAIQKFGISYCNPPASFGEPGQKVRLPGEIAQYKLATCLETSLLFAAVMEKSELHPVLVFTNGHCFVGCHLIDASFENVVVNDLQTIRKRADVDEFVAIETTLVTHDDPFNAAERMGRARLDDEPSFVCAVDILRSRESGIRPLALGSGFSSDYVATGRDVNAEDNGNVRKLQKSVDLSTLKQAEATLSRIERWTRKLLDFSARNKLLNIPKNSHQVIPLICPDVAALEDQVAANNKIAIRSIADSMGEKALDDLLNNRLAKEQCEAIVNAELSHHRLCVMMSPREVHRRLTDLYHDAKLAIEESGVNTLFLSIGVLQWLEPGVGSGRKSYRAPILMVPVRLERASMADGVKLVRLDEDTIINTTLLEFLRAQFTLTFPGLDPLPVDEHGVDVAMVLQIFRQRVKEMTDWEVFDDSYIGCFSFGKFVMWKDMTDRIDELKKNPLVNHLVAGGGIFDDGVEVFPADEVSRRFNPGDVFCPVSFDSSQLTAVLYSGLGKTFVLHGPPGTGKSQTITNIIAHNLATGKRVLFVSEKKAALDVVKKRLDRIGLTPFCLELHSNKTEKGKFYEQIKEALNVPETAMPDEWERMAADYEKCRAELDEYIHELHRPYPNGLSAYSCFSRAIQHGGDSHPELLECDCLRQDVSTYNELRQSVEELIAEFREVPEGAIREIPELKPCAWSPAYERQLQNAAAEYVAAVKELRAPLAEIYSGFSLSSDYSAKTVSDLFKLLARMRGKDAIERRFLAGVGDTTPSFLLSLHDIAVKRNEAAKKLSSYKLDQLEDLDFAGIESRLEENRNSFFIARFFKNRALLKELAILRKTGGLKLTIEKLTADLSSMKEYTALGKEYAEKAGSAPDERTTVPDALRAAIEKSFACKPRFDAAYAQICELVAETPASADIMKLEGACNDLADNLPSLRNVLRYRKTLARAIELRAGGIANYIAENDDGNLDALELFDNAYAAKMLDAILAIAPTLAEFSGLTHEARIGRFRELDRKYTELSRKVVFAKLAATLPRRRNGPCPDGSELGMIKRECEKKTRQKAVRLMLADSKTIIPALKPCFLMSPLSVAQYLPVDSEPFDLVVFDEASQIPVWDAIGVIARGKQLVVVGDPKQMPPTSFFQKGEVEDEEDLDEAIADQESILDECLVAGVHSAYLNWHYRSRHESLIAFSNEHYYENRLCTFPSAVNSPRLGVKFVFIEGGRFENSGTNRRVNTAEATALVDYICNELHKPDYKKRSLGIVTFSINQQKLIQTMIEERRESDPLIEKLLPEEGEGAYFVKNLENVQGDESDVILFSIGYAPDSNGRFTMNFGPLNLQGGERRLNVAVTRAREQVIVFSSIHSSQISAGADGRAHAVGAGHLKAFLEYAERGTATNIGAMEKTSGEFFGDVVAKFLADKGYKVDRNVGCSEYRIEIAVRDPKNADRYLLGVDCDGPGYAGQRTAQDRDVNRIGVLRGLGWNMCRVWSVDWAFDRQRAEKHLLDQLEAAENCAVAEKPEPTPSKGVEEAQLKPDTSPEPSPPPTQAVPRHEEYTVWQPAKTFDHDAFYKKTSKRQISGMLTSVIEAEGPICDMVLRRRVCRAWGITRMIESVHGVIDDCMPSKCRVTEHETGKVYWPGDRNPSSYTGFRVPSANPDSKRAIEEIPPEELMNAMREILADFGGCQKEELFKETLKLFGLSTLTAKARKFLEIAFACLQDSKLV